MALNSSWTSEDLAKNLCDDLVKGGVLKEKPAFIRSDREELLAKLFKDSGLDGAKMVSFTNVGPLEAIVRNGTQQQAWVESVVDGLKAMLPEDVVSATVKIEMSEDTKEQMEQARENTRKMRDRADGRKGGGKGRDRDEDDNYGSFGGRDRGGGGYGRGGGGDQECYNCGGMGHISRECEAPRKGKGGGRDDRGGGGGRGRDEECYNCGETGHISRDCREPKKGKGGGRSGGGDQECYNCGGMGHMSRDCDAPRKGKGGGGKRGGDEECYNCHQVGHLSRDCPEPRRPKGGGRGDDRDDRD